MLGLYLLNGGQHATSSQAYCGVHSTLPSLHSLTPSLACSRHPFLTFRLSWYTSSTLLSFYMWAVVSDFLSWFLSFSVSLSPFIQSFCYYSTFLLTVFVQYCYSVFLSFVHLSCIFLFPFLIKCLSTPLNLSLYILNHPLT